MQILDLVLLALLLLGILNGLRFGLILELASIAGVVVGLALARVAYVPVRDVLSGFVHHPAWLTPVSYIIAFVIFVWAFRILGRWIRRGAHLLRLGPIDRIGGAVLGFLQTAILLNVLLVLAQRINNPTVKHAIKHSTVAGDLLHYLPSVQHLIPHILH